MFCLSGSFLSPTLSSFLPFIAFSLVPLWLFGVFFFFFGAVGSGPSLPHFINNKTDAKFNQKSRDYVGDQRERCES